MKIGIDARFYGSIGKGLGRYTQKLIEHLERIDAENQYYVFLRRENFKEYEPQNKNFKKVLADYSWYSFAEQIFFPALLYKYKLDLMHFPHFNVPVLYRKQFVLTVHDLILIHFPTLRGTTLSPFLYWLKYVAYKVVIYSAIARAKKIFTVSEFTKSDIIAHYPKAVSKTVVTYEAVDPFEKTFQKNSQCVLEKYGIIKPYIMYVGNAYPHKNLEKLLDAFDLLSTEKGDLRLALVGKEDFFYARLRNYAEKENIANVHFLGFVPDDDLGLLYKEAAVYVFPSLYEGFGLPPLEAMSEGVPVVSSDHASMKEVLGDAALYVNPSDAGGLKEALRQIIDNEEVKEMLVRKGSEQVKKYSWKKMAQQTLDTYRNFI